MCGDIWVGGHGKVKGNGGLFAYFNFILNLTQSLFGALRWSGTMVLYGRTEEGLNGASDVWHWSTLLMNRLSWMSLAARRLIG
jgi:hypothetical protein